MQQCPRRGPSPRRPVRPRRPGTGCREVRSSTPTRAYAPADPTTRPRSDPKCREWGSSTLATPPRRSKTGPMDVPRDPPDAVDKPGDHGSREADWLTWKHTTVDGRPAAYGEAGEGPPVVFLHGWGLDHKAYK